MTDEAIDQVVAAVKRHLGDDPKKWPPWPEGWRDDIEMALVDAVFSVRAPYKTTRGRGVHALVTAWAGRRNRPINSTTGLAEEISKAGVRAWAGAFGSNQTSPGRQPTAPEGNLKAATVLEAARALSNGTPPINTADDVRSNVDEAVRRLKDVKGIGHATVNYFLILLGVPGVKPDTLLHRFVSEALAQDAGSKTLTSTEVVRLVSSAAKRFAVEPHILDHAIWRYESDRSKRG